MTLIVSCWWRKGHQWWMIELDYLPNRRKNGSGVDELFLRPNWALPVGAAVQNMRYKTLPGTIWSSHDDARPPRLRSPPLSFTLSRRGAWRPCDTTSFAVRAHLCHEQCPDSLTPGNRDVIGVWWVLAALRPRGSGCSDCRILEPYSNDVILLIGFKGG